MNYRDATARDIDAIAGLHAESWRRNYRGAFSDSHLAVTFSPIAKRCGRPASGRVQRLLPGGLR
jgi:hypothetical protein